MRIAEGNDFESRSEGTEAVAILFVGRKADDGDGAAMKIVGADDDLGFVLRNALDLVAPLARGLERGFDGLGAGVHGQRHVEAGQIVEFLVEQRELLVAEGARGERDFPRLLVQSLQNLGMTVSLVHRGIRRQAIEVAFALDVIHPHAFGALDDHVERMVVVSSILVFEFDEVIGARGFLYEFGCHKRSFVSRVRVCNCRQVTISPQSPELLSSLPPGTPRRRFLVQSIVSSAIRT